MICGTFAMGAACYLALTGDVEAHGGLATPLATAEAARRALIHAAALPVLAYLSFLLVNLVLNLWQSLLSLPGKLDRLARDDDDEIGRGQPDTVTTHE